MAVFIISFLLFITPHLWDDTYAQLMEGEQLPCMTQWVRNAVPEEFAGVACVATMVAVTHLCLGIMLLVTAATEIARTKRTVFLTSASWGILLLVLVVMVIAQVLPFISIASCLRMEEEIHAEVTRAHIWSVGTAVYCVLLVMVTVFVCKNKRKRP
jgi:succinate dehydrogenase/fumarate reductase cytochrome b subunit